MTLAVVNVDEPRYPALLRQLNDPPIRLFVRGAGPDVLSRPSVAVVGARTCGHSSSCWERKAVLACKRW